MPTHIIHLRLTYIFIYGMGTVIAEKQYNINFQLFINGVI